MFSKDLVLFDISADINIKKIEKRDEISKKETKYNKTFSRKFMVVQD
jgi:hypothetical protein